MVQSIALETKVLIPVVYRLEGWMKSKLHVDWAAARHILDLELDLETHTPSF